MGLENPRRARRWAFVLAALACVTPHTVLAQDATPEPPPAAPEAPPADKPAEPDAPPADAPAPPADAPADAPPADAPADAPPADAPADAPAETPTDNPRTEGAPAQGAPEQEAPAEGTPGEGAPADAAPAEGAPGDAGPADAAPAEGPTQAEGTPDQGSTDAGDGAGEAAPQEDDIVLEPGADRQTGLEGKIADAKTGEGLADAPVLIIGGGNTRPLFADENGQFRAYLPPGRYTLRSYYDLHHGARLDGIRVRRGRFTRANLLLDAISEEDSGVEELEIAYVADTGSELAQLNLRKESVNVQDSISAEEISRSGDSSAASAAKRVVGVTIDENNQLIVRGLGGRYSRTLLNGVAIPATDPDRPGVQLDIFPTSILSSMAVVKTARPDLPGAWAGGLLLIDSTSFPREFELEAGLSLGGTTVSTFRDDFLTYSGGNTDWLGYDDGTRALPDDFSEAKLESQRCDRVPDAAFCTKEEANQEANRLPNIWGRKRTTALPKIGVDLSGGDSFRLNKKLTAGYVFALGYSHNQRRVPARVRPGSQIFLDEEQNFEAVGKGGDFSANISKTNVDLNALGAAGLRIGEDNDLNALVMFNRAMEDEVNRRTGLAFGTLGPTEEWQLRFVGRSILFGQLMGDHRNLGGTDLRLRWTGYAATGSRDEPDTRQVTYGPTANEDDPSIIWRPKSSSGSRLFFDLQTRDFGGVLSMRHPLWSEAYATIGGRAGSSRRDFAVRRLVNFKSPEVNDQQLLAQPPEILFRDLGPFAFVRELTRPQDSFKARSMIYAGYAMIETPLFGSLKFAGGARVEAFDQKVDVIDPFTGELVTTTEQVEVDGNVETIERDASTDRTDVDILPSGTLVYGVSDSVFIRGAYGFTVARPIARELAEVQFYDFELDRNVKGSPDVQRTRIHNMDLRFEWFFGKTDLIALSGFYKLFDDPIELVIEEVENLSSVFQNADESWSRGLEFEVRMGMEHLSDSLKDFSVGGNVALIQSGVEINDDDGQSTPTNRPMFNQSPYVVNLALRYFNEDADLSLSLVYNVIGRRITSAGALAAQDPNTGNPIFSPNVTQQPFHQLDLVGSWQAHEHVKLKLKLKNLLFDTLDNQLGDLLIQRKFVGMSASVGVAVVY